jgi:hypothetical protein
MTFTSNEDRQLWLVETDKFRFPIYCRKGSIGGKPIWHAVSALPLKHSEMQLLNDLLASQAKFVNRVHHYLETPELVAYKAEGVTPEFYYEGDSKFDVEPVSQDPGDVMEDFYSGINERYARHVYQRLKLTDWPAFKAIYQSIFALMPAYMIRTMKPVDVGWAKIGIIPFRANWKQILLSKFPGVAKLAKYPFEKIVANLEITDFSLEARKTDLLSIKQPHHDQACIRLRPELVPTQRWAFYANRLERARCAKVSKGNYVAHVGSLIEKAWPLILEAFVDFLRETRTPCGNLRKGVGGCGVELVAAWKVRGYDPRNNDHRPVSPVTSIPYGSLYPIRQEDLGEEVTDLPELPHLQQEPENLRNSGSDAGGVAG